ncbi:MAG: hypothetical protein V8S73_15765 [Lachnospiraceae bacterium]
MRNPADGASVPPYLPGNRINPRAEEIMKTHLENGKQRITLVNPAGWKLLGFVREADCLHKSPKMYRTLKRWME